MNEQIDSQIKLLQQKLQLLVKEFQLTKKENVYLKLEVEELQTKINTQSTEIEKLRQQTQLSKIKSFYFSNEDKAELEEKINAYLKEIDKCILLLNAE